MMTERWFGPVKVELFAIRKTYLSLNADEPAHGTNDAVTFLQSIL